MFSVGYTSGIIDLFDELEITNQIEDVYFSIPNNFTSTARYQEFSELTFRELKKIQARGIKLHLVLNGATYNQSSYSEDGINQMINIINYLEVDMLTTNNTALMRSKQFQELNNRVEIKNSVNNKIKTLEDVIQYHTFFNFKSIILDRSLNRNIDELNKIILYTKENKIKTTILVNEGCISNCPYKQFCDDSISNHDLASKGDFSNLTCGSDFSTDISLTLKSPFILPSSINKYRDLGVDYFKIACRGKSLNDVRLRLKAYIFENKNISLSSILDTNPHHIYQSVNSNVLEEFNFFEHTSNCKNKCHECNYCDILASKFLSKEK